MNIVASIKAGCIEHRIFMLDLRVFEVNRHQRARWATEVSHGILILI